MRLAAEFPVWAAGCLAGLAVAVGGAGPVVAARRLARILPTSGPGRRTRGGPAAGLAAVSETLRRILDRRPAAKRSRQDATAGRLVELLDGFAAELGAGQLPAVALERACAGLDERILGPPLAAVVASLRAGRDPAEALDAASSQPGCLVLRWLAAAMRITDSTGAGLAPVVERVATAARADADHRRDVAAHLASPRATARLLAFLPVLGLALGELLGAHPVALLTGTSPGLACLALGLGLELAGLRWTERLARSAELL